ncbi:MAG TPA: hypothetical protein VHE35_30875 [Kofleriaceae bacterium]|nr:hypothetical protein [Kofleriaceae bacterium]
MARSERTKTRSTTRTKPAGSAAPAGRTAEPNAAPPATEAPARQPRVFALPLAFIVALAGFGLLPRSLHEPGVCFALLGAAAVLLGWTALLHRSAATRPRRIAVVIRRPHWVQPIVQGAIYLYWSLSWPEVGAYAYLIAAQLAFAYAFDLLFVWSRRDTYELGFGPFPIILSINLFLWFKPDWFALQLVMIAIGFAAKELLRWDKGGRRGHIFNPSSFPLAVVSIGLLVAGATHITWGVEVATTIERPRHIYEMLFLVSLPGQIFFGVALMPLAALLTAHLLSLAYFAHYGTYFFVGPVPIAVFLGMLLLFTDPATAPRTDLGRIVFGVLYGAMVFVAYELLDRAGLPTFYDKLLPVPLLNLSIRAIDRFASRPAVAWLDPGRLLAGLRERRRFLVYTAAWAVTFLAVRATHGVGDTHPANRLPFWQQACKEGKRHACRTLVTMESVDCERGSGWACNELGIYVAEERQDLADRYPPWASFQRSCELNFQAGCDNVGGRRPAGYAHEPPSLGDYDILLEAKALPRNPQPEDLLETACAHGWTDGCMGLGVYFSSEQYGPRSPARAVRGFERACTRGNAEGCASAAELYRAGDGVARDDARASRLQARACSLGRASACAP